ncbi:UNVERIFIED_CONTAM: hypothetical protein PYX00_001286 [Menopon gallinae]|uniref:CTLH domain-containing protein n=1 Tax=Menopon gallinae TaxID=328185 RepID=A0AAW2IDB3_9NEOP
MPSAHLTLREEDVVRLALEFLHNRDLHISQLSIERETGVINGSYSDDVLFLRQLILDGQWDDVLEFIQPLETLPSFDMKKFKYCILRRKYEELLCIKSEAMLLTGAGNNVDNAVEEVVKVLRELEKVVPSKDDYSHLCLLLTLPKLNDHLSYKDWNPSHARVQCFREVLPIVEKFLPNDKKVGHDERSSFAKNDRLIQLIIKGILYESCVNYCQAKATGTTEMHNQEINFTRILDGNVGLGDSDLSLISWLQCVPSNTFSIPFEQRTLNVDVEKLEKPTLETSWTEHMLVTPIKPKTFPHSAMPFTRPRSAADVMSRSLLPAFEGLGQGLTTSRNGSPLLMTMSSGDPHNMSRSSFASFHLTGYKNNKLMNTSVDRLFENGNEDIFLSTTYADFQTTPAVVETSTPKPTTNAVNRKQSKSPEPKKGSNVSTTTSSPDHRGRESPALSTARSSRSPVPLTPQLVNGSSGDDGTVRVSDNFDGDLMKEFQRQKQRLQETLIAKGKQREELLREIHASEMRCHEDW